MANVLANININYFEMKELLCSTISNYYYHSKGKDEDVIDPWQSTMFGYYTETGNDDHVVDMEQLAVSSPEAEESLRDHLVLMIMTCLRNEL